MVRPIFSEVLLKPQGELTRAGDTGNHNGFWPGVRAYMSDDEKLSSSLADLNARLRAADAAKGRGDRNGPEPRGAMNPSGLGIATRIGVELVTTTLVGTALGYGLDRWLGIAPWLMIVGLLFGGAAGVSNVYRVVKGLDDGVGLGRAIEEKKRRDAAQQTEKED
jgi:ATP synthase protein I